MRLNRTQAWRADAWAKTFLPQYGPDKLDAHWDSVWTR